MHVTLAEAAPAIQPAGKPLRGVAAKAFRILPTPGRPEAAPAQEAPPPPDLSLGDKRPEPSVPAITEILPPFAEERGGRENTPTGPAKGGVNLAGAGSGPGQGAAAGHPSVAHGTALQGEVSGAVSASGKLPRKPLGQSGAPAFLHRTLPVYPPLARRLGKEGRVVLQLFIDRDGTLRQMEVVEGAPYGFTEAALEAARRSTYIPARRNGVYVSALAILPVRFRLE